MTAKVLGQLRHTAAAVAEWVERLCSEREIPRSNPGILPLLSSACRERNGPPCRLHAYTVFTPIGGKGRCRTRRDLRDHRTQTRKSAGERSTPDLKPVRKGTQSPKQEQSVAPQTGPWSNKNLKKKKKKKKKKKEMTQISAMKKHACKHLSSNSVNLQLEYVVVHVGLVVSLT